MILAIWKLLSCETCDTINLYMCNISWMSVFEEFKTVLNLDRTLNTVTLTPLRDMLHLNTKHRSSLSMYYLPSFGL